MQAPQLLYHADSPTLYPTNTQSSLLTVRFPSPVRISSLRITPEGVASPTGAGYVFLGLTTDMPYRQELIDRTTHPARWTGEIFLNSSNANPVNALERREIEYEGGEWPVELEVGMPEDVTTRLLSLLAPVQSITLSIYGYHAAGPSSPAPLPARSDAQAKEDWTWVSAWAGGVGGLIAMLGSAAGAEAKERVMECLELLDGGPGGIIPLLLAQPPALSYILQHVPQSTLSKAIFDTPENALHPNVRSTIPVSHPLHTLISPSHPQRRKAAWRNLEVGISLHVLAQSKEADLMDVEEGMEGSNLSRLLQLAEEYASPDHGAKGERLGLILDILDTPLISPVAQAHLAEVVPKLTVISNICNKANRPIIISTSSAPIVARSLLLFSTHLVGTTPAFAMAQQLAQPYLPHLPLDSPYHTAFSTSSPQSTLLAAVPATADSRRLSRLFTSLSSPRKSAIVHTATPAELVNLLAPALYALLSTAPEPLLGIPSALANPTPESQASAWAGKVYSSNEFREREEARIGLGIKGARTGQVPVLGGFGPAQGAGVATDGLEPGTARMSRPASRHVDDFGR